MLSSHSSSVHGPFVSLGPLELTDLPLALAALSRPQPNTSALGPQLTSSGPVTQPTLPASALLHVPELSLKPATHDPITPQPCSSNAVPFTSNPIMTYSHTVT
ncbi:hypothetical protein D8674_026233 [Pyrus ussuriensis x Pyrus communis]|uniref:Uncharacterized protein n=1 Tax=Pyrus ussuriensis x Pyrus communis TaxID=2448454 RepID=A0A5N5I7J3_9ROSA|nr:hypothetical protein D8674_026233 [Pyrus ussuriensis x Pyrus communis]